MSIRLEASIISGFQFDDGPEFVLILGDSAWYIYPPGAGLDDIHDGAVRPLLSGTGKPDRDSYERARMILDNPDSDESKRASSFTREVADEQVIRDADNLLTAGRALYGNDWAFGVARLLGWNADRVRRYLGENRPTPVSERVWVILATELRRRAREMQAVADRIDPRGGGE